MRILETSERLRSIVTRRSLLPLPEDREDPRWTRGWNHLFERYGPAMARYAARLLAPALGRARAEQDAPDVVQAYLRARPEISVALSARLHAVCGPSSVANSST